MKLKQIKLHNIRSYTEEIVDFPNGSTLLWGNIGSGKSTILLALDFALFGLQRGNLTGASLLRNGEVAGYVQLAFEIDKKEIVILRALKRTKTGVTQDSGFVIRNGVKEEKTAVELRQVILELLCYPRDLLTKNKSLIYRYTVYTPQEEMKSILLGPKEERLDTLRRVFGVDKYKRIRDNAKQIAIKLRERKRHYEGYTIDLEQKRSSFNLKNEELRTIQNKILANKPVVEMIRVDHKAKKEKLIKLQEERDKVQIIKRELAKKRTELTHILENKEVDYKRILKLQSEITQMQEEVKEVDENVLLHIQEKKAEYEEKQKLLRIELNKVQEIKTKIGHVNHLTANIEKLQSCPTCFQQVQDDYKKSVRDNNTQEIVELQIKYKEHQEKSLVIEKDIQKLKRELDALQKQEALLQVIKVKKVQKKNKEEELGLAQTKVATIKVQVGEVNKKIIELEQELEKLSELENLFKIEEKNLGEIENSLREKEKELHGHQISKKHQEELIQELSKEIKSKEESIILGDKINKTLFWITDYFSPLMNAMEKNILFKVHADFNHLFEKWFSILINNEDIKMSLDVEYSPKILQNGYDIEYPYLSGGEKTAGALAYRLALNQVINSLNAGIKTNDILILDEPTDGFSQEQLENMKSLMEEINIPQVIIVSHKPEIEAFVQNIVRIEKNQHVSSIIR